MDCTSETIGELEIDAVVLAASAIYANHDRNRSLWDVWSHALHHAAAIAEETRKQLLTEAGDEKLRREIADLSLWLFTMLVKLKGPLGTPIQANEVAQDTVVRISVSTSDLMWNRYPGVCPWCYCATHTDSSLRIDENEFWRPCSCDALKIAMREKIPEELSARANWTRRLAMEHRDRRPQSLDSWQERIAALYRERLTKAPLAEVSLHLIEEMGEVSDRLIRMYDYREGDAVEELIGARQIRLEDELADVLSWLFGLVECLGLQSSVQAEGDSATRQEMVSNNRLLLSQILWAKYGSNEERAFWCRHCKKKACACRILLIQSKQQVEDLVRSLSSSRIVGSE